MELYFATDFEMKMDFGEILVYFVGDEVGDGVVLKSEGVFLASVLDGATLWLTCRRACGAATIRHLLPCNCPNNPSKELARSSRRGKPRRNSSLKLASGPSITLFPSSISVRIILASFFRAQSVRPTFAHWSELVYVDTPKPGQLSCQDA